MPLSCDLVGSPPESIPHLMRDQDDGRSHTVVIPAKLVPNSDRGAGISGTNRLLAGISWGQLSNTWYGKYMIYLIKKLLNSLKLRIIG